MTGRGSSLATGRMRTFTRPMTSVCQDLHRACSDRSMDGSGQWGTAGRAAEWLGSHLRSLSLVLPSESVWENDVFRTETRTAWYLVSCIVRTREQFMTLSPSYILSPPPPVIRLRPSGLYICPAGRLATCTRNQKTWFRHRGLRVFRRHLDIAVYLPKGKGQQNSRKSWPIARGSSPAPLLTIRSELDIGMGHSKHGHRDEAPCLKHLDLDDAAVAVHASHLSEESRNINCSICFWVAGLGGSGKQPTASIQCPSSNHLGNNLGVLSHDGDQQTLGVHQNIVDHKGEKKIEKGLDHGGPVRGPSQMEAPDRRFVAGESHRACGMRH